MAFRTKNCNSISEPWSQTPNEKIATANYQDGYDAGMEKVEAKKAIEIARKMLAEGLPFDVVARCSGLTEEQVRVLK